MQHRDIPITTKDDDKLNFSQFASKIARGILNYKQSETLIFSIEGEWGSGKTSLINLIKNELKKENSKSSMWSKIQNFIGIDTDTIKIMHFNPWLLTSIEQTITNFFHDLKIILKNESHVTKALNDFENMLTLDNIKLKIAFAEVDYKIDNKKSLESLKGEISQLLNKLNQKIIVIIDDIDRLTDKETEFIFRLTKGIADFDNLIYIMLYDKGVVSKSLEKFKSENGQKYLEKIVQYSLSVPKPHSTTIQKLLFEQLDEILSDLEIKEKKYIFQQNYWGYIHPILNRYIRTVRDVSQIINIMSFEYPIICEDVNFADFFIISLIKLKKYELYEHIKNKPQDFFINPKEIILDSKKEEARIKENFEQNMKHFHDYRDLLEIMFPLLRNSSYFEHQTSSHKDKYISDIYYHESYFAFTLSDDKISMQEYYTIEDFLQNYQYLEFEEKILEIDKKNKTAIFLDMFEAIGLKALQDNQSIENIFMNLIKISTKLESKDNKGFLTATPILWRCERIAFEAIIKHTELETYVQQFIIEDNQIDLRVKISLFEFLEKENNNGNYNLSEETINFIKSKIRQVLEEITLNSLILDSELSYLIMRFDLVDASLERLSNEIEEFIFNSKENFFLILKIFKRTSMVSSSNRGIYERHSICKECLEKIIALNKMNDFIKNLDKATLDNDQNKLLEFWEKGDRWY